MICPQCNRCELLLFISGDITLGSGEISSYYRCISCKFKIVEEDDD